LVAEEYLPGKGIVRLFQEKSKCFLSEHARTSWVEGWSVSSHTISQLQSSPTYSPLRYIDVVTPESASRGSLKFIRCVYIFPFY
jgi:hypothetical protein